MSGTRVFGAVAVLAGMLFGLGAYTFVYARGYSYVTNDPAACANCHVMQDHYDAWTRSSHRAVAACNDCHTPPGHAEKYLVKARNGFWHSFYFTTGTYPDPIRITPRNQDVTERACRGCHEPITSAIDPFPAHADPARGGSAGATQCIRCHAEVGHIE
jgi:cytochrome c nitrite reductase small subunit